MFLLKEPPWLLLLTAVVGYLCGRARGRAGWGLILGLLFGPFGCLAVMLIPAAKQRPPFFRFYRGPAGAGPASPREESEADDGSACPRCQKPVGRRDKACGHCGNVLVPIRYAVEGGPARD
jgi:hypothetical protein